MAWISADSITGDSITVYLSNLDTNWASGERTVYWYIGYAGNFPTVDDYYDSAVSYLEDGASSGGYVTFDYLDANTEYGIYCAVYYEDTFLADFDTWVTTAEKTTIDKWDWSFSNGSAFVQQTIDAYYAVAFNGYTTEFSYLVWNDMVNKVYDVIRVTTNWWDSTYASYDETMCTSTSYTLTSDRFNSLRNNIELVGNHLGLGYRTGIGEVSSYTSYVDGSLFLILVDYINDCIDRLYQVV